MSKLFLFVIASIECWNNANYLDEFCKIKMNKQNNKKYKTQQNILEFFSE